MKSLSRVFALAIISGLVAIPAGVAATKPPVEDQPHMQQALEALRQARHHLEEAVPDKGGHRAAAIRACDQAIKQAEMGVKFADHHDHDGDHDHDHH
jgi:hypothetical protein